MSRYSTLGVEESLPSNPDHGVVGERDDRPDRRCSPRRLQRLCHQTYQTQRTWENDDGAPRSQSSSTFASRPPPWRRRRISRVRASDLTISSDFPRSTNTFPLTPLLALKWVTGSGFSCSCHGAIHLFAMGLVAWVRIREKAIYGREPALWIILSYLIDCSDLFF